MKKKTHPIESFPPGFYVMLAGAHLRGPFRTRKAAVRSREEILRDPLVFASWPDRTKLPRAIAGLESVKPQITIEKQK